MKRNLTILIALFLLWNFSTTIRAQTPESTPTNVVTSQDRSIKNLPYSAEGTGETVQILADGNKIKTTQKQRMFRDSLGRTRDESESNFVGRTNISIYINDPVEGFRYRLNTEQKTAIRIPLNLNRNVRISPPPKGYSSKQENLGSKIIEGIEANGFRMITKIPPGLYGNEKELETTYESWSSPEMRITIYSKSNDPRFGERTFQLTNIKREEPDASLFKVPDDYKIIDQELNSSNLIAVPEN